MGPGWGKRKGAGLAFGGFVDDRVEFYSPLSRTECVERLNANMESMWQVFGTSVVVGRASPSRLNAHMRISYRNSFQTYLRARLEDDGRGTRLRCKFGMSVFVKVFLGLWLGFLAFLTIPEITIATAFVTGARTSLGNETPSGLAISFLMATAAIGMVGFGRWLARDEEGALIRFLCRTLNANERSPSPSPIITTA
jgi:hypothetical protein